MRILTMLEVLQVRGRATGPELARRLEVSGRTVQRYAMRLQDLGVPVEATRGRGGAYRLKPGFRLPPLMFTNDEAFALVLGLRSLTYLGISAFATSVQGAGAKVERVLPLDVREGVRVAEEAMHLEAFPWTVATNAMHIVRAAGAVQKCRCVSFSYEAHDHAQTQREVEPYGVLHYDGRWYLVGRCRLRKALRSFRLDRVTDLETLGEVFERPDAFDARAFLVESLPFVQSPHKVEEWLELPVEAACKRLAPSRASESGGGTKR